MKHLTLPVLIIFWCLPGLQAQDRPDPAIWQVQADQIDPDHYFGVTVANGMIGLVSSPEPLKVSAVVLNGVYDHYGRGRVSNILQTFNHINLEMMVDGDPVTASNVANYSQTLDMYRATLVTSFEVGDRLQVRQEMRALRHLPYCSMVEVELTARKDVSIVAMNAVQAPAHLREVQNFFNEIVRPHVEIPLLTSVARSPTGKQIVAASSALWFEEAHGQGPVVKHEERDYDWHGARFEKHLRAGETYRFYLFSTSLSSMHYDDPHNEAERLTIFAYLEGPDRLVQKHEEAWRELWKSDILLEGDPRIQRDIHFALYHLYSFARAGTALSLSPMGLSGLGYNGHVFWDTELWMYPPLLVLQPEIARSLLEYRYERLDAARQNAFAHGYRGAMYPWESAEEGSEDTPVWALTGPFQHHITADVGWACWKYYQVTADRQWLAERGYPILREVADFWASRVERNGPGRYDIKNVIGANEYQENIDNNAFTNGMARTVLRYAAQAARELGLEPDPDWEQVADNIPILQFADGTTRENATYEGETIKQADVNLLAYPLDLVSGEAAIRRDLEYYGARMDPRGPAMGFSVLATLYARLQEPEKAYELFLQSYRPNEVPPFGVLAETANGTNPYFATGAGGMLQAVIFGFAGLEVTDQGIVQLPARLPAGWKSLRLTGVGSEEASFQRKE